MGLPKQVRFPEDEKEMATVVVEIPSREDFTPEDMQLMFFTKDEFAEMRVDARSISRESHRHGYSKNLEDTYDEKSTEAQDKLNKWALHGYKRRGLERWSNKDHGDKRQSDQFQVIMSVLQAQDDMMAESKTVDPEKLRKVSYKATRVARHFARMMGKADSYALSHDCVPTSENSFDARASFTTTETRATLSSVASDGKSLEERLPLPCVDEIKDSSHSRSGMFRRLRLSVLKNKNHQANTSRE